MVGPVASGKSTFANHYKRFLESMNMGETMILSTDELKVELFGDINDQTHNQELFQELHRRIKQNIDTKNLIIVAPNVTARSRRALLNCVKKKECHKVAVIMTTSIEDCKECNANRDNVVVVPEWVIDKQIGNYEIPYYEEGFDDIVFDKFSEVQISNYRVGFSNERDHLFKEMIGFNQRNSHHLYTLDEHCLRVAVELARPEWNRFNNRPYIRAGKLHDYGKLFTGEPKTDEEGNPDPSGDYKYYSHMNVGTYRLLSKIYDLGFNKKNEILEFLFYVNYHMEPFFWRDKTTNRIKDKTQKKMLDRFGQEKYYNLLLFNLADRIASGTARDQVEEDREYLEACWKSMEENDGIVKLERPKPNRKFGKFKDKDSKKGKRKGKNIEITIQKPVASKPKYNTIGSKHTKVLKSNWSKKEPFRSEGNYTPYTPRNDFKGDKTKKNINFKKNFNQGYNKNFSKPRFNRQG